MLQAIDAFLLFPFRSFRNSCLKLLMDKKQMRRTNEERRVEQNYRRSLQLQRRVTCRKLKNQAQFNSLSRHNAEYLPLATKIPLNKALGRVPPLQNPSNFDKLSIKFNVFSNLPQEQKKNAQNEILMQICRSVEPQLEPRALK